MITVNEWLAFQEVGDEYVYRHNEVLVGPDMAERLLENNEGNRTISKADVKRITADILRGDWRMSFDPIVFTDNGRLLNGQHRLSAIADSGKTVRCVVAITKEERQTALDVMGDFGRKRQASDYTEIQNKIISVGNVLHRFMEGANPSPIRSVELAEKLEMIWPEGMPVRGEKPYTRAPYKLGFIYACHFGDADYALEQAKAFAIGDISRLSRYMGLFYKTAILDRSPEKHVQTMQAIRACEKKRSSMSKFYKESSSLSLIDLRKRLRKLYDLIS